MITRGLKAPKSTRRSLPYTHGKATPRPEPSSHHSTAKKRVPKTKQVEVISDNEDDPESNKTPKTKPKRAPTVIVGEYLLNAKTIVGVQAVYRDCRSLVEGVFTYSGYIAESTVKVETYSNTHSVTPVLISSTAVVYSKGMKKSDERLSVDVHRAADWIKVESVVHHLAKSLSRGITVDFTIKYSTGTTTATADDADDELLSDSSTEDNHMPIKRARRVYPLFFVAILMIRQRLRVCWKIWRPERKREVHRIFLNSSNVQNVSSVHVQTTITTVSSCLVKNIIL